jgi:hypothetical protein
VGASLIVQLGISRASVCKGKGLAEPHHKRRVYRERASYSQACTSIDWIRTLATRRIVFVIVNMLMMYTQLSFPSPHDLHRVIHISCIVVYIQSSVTWQTLNNFAVISH